MKETISAIVLLIIIIVAWVCMWLTYSYYEAKVYTGLTNKEVTTWQAMWVDLRITNQIQGIQEIK